MLVQQDNFRENDEDEPKRCDAYAFIDKYPADGI